MHTHVDTTSSRHTKRYVHTFPFDVNIHFLMHVFRGSLVYMSILMFMREMFDILLSLVILESNEKFGINIYLSLLK